MAPPNKRRRVEENSTFRPTPSYPHLAVSEPSPTLSHTVEQLEHRPTLALVPQQAAQRIDEVHLQVQKRGGPEYHEHHHAQRRQVGTAVSSLLDSTLTVTVLQWADITGGTALSTINDDLGGTYGTTQTLTLVSSPLPSDTTSPSSTEATTSSESSGSAPSSTPSEGFIDSSPSGTGVSSTTSSGSAVSSSASPSNASASIGSSTISGVTSNGSASSTSPASARMSAAGLSGSSISSLNSTRTDTTRPSRASGSSSSSATSSPVSLSPGVFLATLSDGDVVTITRSDEPYATSFANGRVSTISPLSSSSASRGDDDSSRTTTITQTTNDPSDPQRSTQRQSTATSVNIVNGPTETQAAPATRTQGSISSTSSAGGGGGGGGSGTAAPPGTIAGGVVGGFAGLAVILIVALLLLRWWKRKAQNGHHALPPADFNPEPPQTPHSQQQPGMAERAGLRPLVGAVPAFFRHSNRSNPPPPAERGFQRVSGRKLPSQFSAGMSSSSPPPPDMPLAAPGARSPAPGEEHERNLSATSFYRDSDGFYGGTGDDQGPFAGHSPSPSESLEGPPGAAGAADGGNMTLSPGPRRTPTVHRGGPYTMASGTTPGSPAGGVGSPLMGGFSPARSGTPASSSVVDERGSRFTEEV